MCSRVAQTRIRIRLQFGTERHTIPCTICGDMQTPQRTPSRPTRNRHLGPKEGPTPRCTNSQWGTRCGQSGLKSGGIFVPTVSWLSATLGFVGIKGILTNNMTKGEWFYMLCACVYTYIYICIAYRVHKPWYKKRWLASVFPGSPIIITTTTTQEFENPDPVLPNVTGHDRRVCRLKVNSFPIAFGSRPPS